MLSEKKPHTKGHVLFGSTYVNCPEQANLRRPKADEWLLREVTAGYEVSPQGAEDGKMKVVMVSRI